MNLQTWVHPSLDSGSINRHLISFLIIRILYDFLRKKNHLKLNHGASCSDMPLCISHRIMVEFSCLVMYCTLSDYCISNAGFVTVIWNILCLINQSWVTLYLHHKKTVLVVSLYIAVWICLQATDMLSLSYNKLPNFSELRNKHKWRNLVQTNCLQFTFWQVYN